jgi:hypothetical protein
MMPILANTRIKLGSSEPKKNAIVSTPGTGAAGDEVAIWAASAIDPALSQSVVGDFLSLLAYAKSNMPEIKAAGTDPVVVFKRFGAGQNDISINGIPDARDLRLEIGAEVAVGSKSHFLNRTVTRLIERWLEEAKTGYLDAVPPPPVPGGEPTAEITGSNTMELGGKWQPGTTLRVSVRLTDPDNQTEDDTLDIVIPTGAPSDGWDAGTAASVAANALNALVHYRAQVSGNSVIISSAAPANTVGFLSVEIV